MQCNNHPSRYFLVHQIYDAGEFECQVVADRDELIKHLVDGQYSQFCAVSRIDEIDLEAGTSSDVSEAVLDDAQWAWSNRNMGEPNAALVDFDECIAGRKIAARRAELRAEWAKQGEAA